MRDAPIVGVGAIRSLLPIPAMIATSRAGEAGMRPGSNIADDRTIGSSMSLPIRNAAPQPGFAGSPEGGRPAPTRLPRRERRDPTIRPARPWHDVERGLIVACKPSGAWRRWQAKVRHAPHRLIAPASARPAAAQVKAAARARPTSARRARSTGAASAVKAARQSSGSSTSA